MSRTDRSARRDEFAVRLRRALEGEVFGESLFNALARNTGDGWDPSTLRSLATLEREMRAALESLCHRNDVVTPDLGPAATRGVEAATMLSGSTWASFVDSFATATAGALRGYVKLRAVAPDADPVLELLIAHEEALADFARRVVAGEESPLRSVDAVADRLRALPR